MKLASLRDGTPEGRLVVVSRDVTLCSDARHVAPTLRAALEEVGAVDRRGGQMRAPTWFIPGKLLPLALLSGHHASYRGVAQLVARTAGGREVAGSSPVTPTK